MAATEPIDIVELGVGDAQAGLVLSTEAGWNQNEADWRFFLSKGVVFGLRDGDQIGRDRCAAALLGGQCLDQHGAGDRGLSPPRHCDQARRCLPRRGDTARPHDLAGRDARWRLRLRSARLHPDAATEAAAAGRSRKETRATRPLSTGNLDALVARDASAMGFDRSTLLSEFGSRPGSRIVSDTRLHRPRSRRPHRATHRSAAG